MDKEESMSFSMYMEDKYNIYDESSEDENIKGIIAETPPDPYPDISRRMREKWVDDGNVSKCKSCKATFRIYRRRSHCRHCGDIFCSDCTKYRSKIPKIIKKIPSRTRLEESIDYNKEVKLCKDCYLDFQQKFKLEKLLTIFLLLDLDIYDFRNISMVCKQWRHVGLVYLSKFRAIQSKLPYSEYNEEQKDILWRNRYLLKGHNVWEVYVIRSVKNDYDRFREVVELYYNDSEEKLKDHKECWDRMCSRYCKPYLDEKRALMLLDVVNMNTSCMNVLVQQIINAFDLPDNEFEWYIPNLLTTMIKSKNLLLQRYIFNRCEKSIRISNLAYHWLKNNNKLHLMDLIEILPPNFYKSIMKSNNLSEKLRECNKIDNIKNILSSGKVISPLAPELGDQTVSGEISIKESATRPVLIPLSKSKILYKRDDVRKDQIIINVIRVIEKILKENGIDINIVTYNVQPTSEQDGFIEIVEDCDTLYNITEKQKLTLLNYLMKHNPDKNVNELRQRFLRSCAVYSVIAFLISFSDSHLDNIMLTQKGDLFYIDYGFVLGQRAKPINVPSIRITTGMLEALGGYHSDGYDEFVELCSEIYDILRRHVNTFIIMLGIIPSFDGDNWTSPNISKSLLHKEIIKKFCPGETYEEAISHLRTRIDKSTNASSLNKYHWIDWFHKHNKERTVKNMLGTAITSTYSGTKSVLGGLYNYLYSFT